MVQTYGVASENAYDPAPASGSSEASALLGEGATPKKEKRDGVAGLTSGVGNLANTIIGSGERLSYNKRYTMTNMSIVVGMLTFPMVRPRIPSYRSVCTHDSKGLCFGWNYTRSYHMHVFWWRSCVRALPARSLRCQSTSPSSLFLHNFCNGLPQGCSVLRCRYCHQMLWCFYQV